tara:strand:- start:1637 stop:1948 length:312 start_codon:yes stop_codon:yes gene_type:complete
MANIITSVPRSIVDGEVDAAFMREVLNGFEVEKRTEEERVQRARFEAKEHVGKTHPIFGKCVATMPAREYFRLIGKYGDEEVKSKEFLKDFNKRFKDLSPNKA